MGHKPFAADRPNYRPARFAQAVREHLSTLVPHGLRDPALDGVQFLTITEVRLSPDYKYADVFFSLMNERNRAEPVEDALNRAAGFLRKELMHALGTKITPHLRFKYDPSFDEGAHIDRLIATAKDEDE